ncbi:hypothetical protein D4764_17G0000670 [Takifugu flavidus]|uniref:Piezo TM1-24 domain-containing protein n=1 Tax=Takifugu flavidus TaxID=433684 RepID=A0A5C6NSX6_9TELE|nr:hypothetical protein D4764_17G0000670 [Takifugu flavidus]
MAWAGLTRSFWTYVKSVCVSVFFTKKKANPRLRRRSLGPLTPRSRNQNRDWIGTFRMSAELAVGVVFRVLLPLTLTAACVVRYNAFSLVYILLLLLLPLLPEPAPSSTSGNTCRCVTAVCLSSFLFLLLQSFFQVTTALLQPEHNCKARSTPPARRLSVRQHAASTPSARQHAVRPYIVAESSRSGRLSEVDTPAAGNTCRCVTAVCLSSFLFLLLQSFFQVTTALLQPEHNCKARSTPPARRQHAVRPPARRLPVSTPSVCPPARRPPTSTPSAVSMPSVCLPARRLSVCQHAVCLSASTPSVCLPARRLPVSTPSAHQHAVCLSASTPSARRQHAVCLSASTPPARRQHAVRPHQHAVCLSASTPSVCLPARRLSVCQHAVCPYIVAESSRSGRLSEVRK